MNDQQKQAKGSGGTNPMEARILGAGEYISEGDLWRYMRYHFRTHPLVNMFGRWLLDNPGAFEALRKYDTKIQAQMNAAIQKHDESHS